MKRGSKKYLLELSDFKTYVKLVAEERMTVSEACFRLNIGRTTYYVRARELDKQESLMERTEAPDEKVRIPRNPSDLRAYVELVEAGRITADEVCRRLNIKMSTYYRKSRELAKMATEGESEESRFIEI